MKYRFRSAMVLGLVGTAACGSDHVIGRAALNGSGAAGSITSMGGSGGVSSVASGGAGNAPAAGAGGGWSVAREQHGCLERVTPVAATDSTPIGNVRDVLDGVLGWHRGSLSWPFGTTGLNLNVIDAETFYVESVPDPDFGLDIVVRCWDHIRLITSAQLQTDDGRLDEVLPELAISAEAPVGAGGVVVFERGEITGSYDPGLEPDQCFSALQINFGIDAAGFSGVMFQSYASARCDAIEPNTAVILPPEMGRWVPERSGTSCGCNQSAGIWFSIGSERFFVNAGMPERFNWILGYRDASDVCALERAAAIVAPCSNFPKEIGGCTAASANASCLWFETPRGVAPSSGTGVFRDAAGVEWPLTDGSLDHGGEPTIYAGQRLAGRFSFTLPDQRALRGWASVCTVVEEGCLE